MELNSALFSDIWVVIWARDNLLFSVLVREDMEESVESFHVRETKKVI